LINTKNYLLPDETHYFFWDFFAGGGGTLGLALSLFFPEGFPSFWLGPFSSLGFAVFAILITF
jgi:hypothetical protein